jgi:hypothetical protein
MSSHAERCPVCYGSGKYTPINDGYSTAVPQPRTCHGCGGKGWVELFDWGNPSTPYVPPYTSPYAPGTTQPWTPWPGTIWVQSGNIWR